MKKVIILLSIIILVAIGYTAVDGMRNVDNNQGYEPDQPISFSHKIHAGENEINCKYCHYGAERSRHAGIPAASVCLNCHSNIKKDSSEIQKIVKAIEEKKPIEWVKVNRLADFVYFNHEQHVGVADIKCQTCHGPVEKMTRMRQDKNLTMGWCIDCHRTSDVVIHGTMKTQKVSEGGGLDCAKCHY